MKKIYFVIILTIISAISYSQCSIATDNSGRYDFVYRNEIYRIYSNEDLENGYISISVSFVIQKSLIEDSKTKYLLEIFSGYGSGKKAPSPRTLVLNRSKRMESINLLPIPNPRNEIIQMGVFEISKDELDWFIKSTITNIEISDNVDGGKLSINVNPRIFNNLANCVKNAAYPSQ